MRKDAHTATRIAEVRDDRALHDPLTGLPNRALFMERLAQALARMVRKPAPLAVLFVDLDRLKPVNDQLGHDTGDSLLSSVADRLSAAVRPSDTVARFGGDEFTVLCERVPGELGAVAVADRIAGALSVPFELDGREVVITASTGIVLTRSAGDDAEQLVAAADAAMYRAKGRGGARSEIGSLQRV